jgi:hypothetical protein
MSDDTIFDEGMVRSPDDSSPFSPDETGIWELPDDLQESPSVEIDWDQIEPGEGVVDTPTCPGFEIEELTASGAPQSPALPEENPAALRGGGI